jgi:hypothetical protein
LNGSRIGDLELFNLPRRRRIGSILSGLLLEIADRRRYLASPLRQHPLGIGENGPSHETELWLERADEMAPGMHCSCHGRNVAKRVRHPPVADLRPKGAKLELVPLKGFMLPNV